MSDDFWMLWAFFTRRAIEAVVRENFPHHLRSWPLLNSFRAESYELREGYVVMVLRDQMGGVPVCDGIRPFPFSDHPTFPPGIEDIEVWHHYLRGKFDLREEDAVYILPDKDLDGDDVKEYIGLLTPEETMFWEKQFAHVIQAHEVHLEAQKPETTPNVTNIIHGSNSRVNVNSLDSSVNVVGGNVVFDSLRQKLGDIEDEDRRAAIAEAIDEMEQAQDSEGFVQKYKEFMGVAADHMGVFMPFIPALSNLLS